jgi:ketosteroid isomerase-like protein
LNLDFGYHRRLFQEDPMSQQNISVVQNGYAAFGRGDIPGFLSLLDAHVEWTTPGTSDLPTAGTRRGPAQVGEFFGVLDQLVAFEHFEPQSFLTDGDRVVVLGTARSKVKGGSGKSLVEHWCHVFTVRNGKIVAFFEYLDTAPFAAELKMAGARA